MSLATRVIPILLCRGRELVKGAQFNSWRSVGVALQAARVHAVRGVDELCILDIGATPEERGPDLKLVAELSEDCFTPITVGGGITTMHEVEQLLRAGADKVCIGTSAIEQPWMIKNCSEKVGCQAIMVAIDYRTALDGQHHTVATRCGKRSLITRDPLTTAKWAEQQGAGEILLTSIEREGMMSGYDLEMIKAVSDAVSIPVIANGGCGTYHHMVHAVQAGAHAVASGAMFQFEDMTPKGAAEYLKAHGIETRTKETA